MLLVPVGICPRVDLIFKEILSNPERLLDFINAVLAPQKFVDVTILNADVKPDVLEQKAIVVDVRAIDSNGVGFQIEMQCRLHKALQERMLYSWSLLYQNQPHKGSDYQKLQPAIAIWLLDENLWPDERPHHCFEVTDTRSGLKLSSHLQIHCFELNKIRFLHDEDSSPRA
ncbi:MAG TPA: Rpn family recombination-promoting nuclease/putative transposase, partial [Myxococcota bacterium]|nr:Rpn family recombination-promoting nuclease/putative transposase [Myxococcota bacterium]